jgi:pimeloyl-ACP methyl ester carboxylesterase
MGIAAAGVGFPAAREVLPARRFSMICRWAWVLTVVIATWASAASAQRTYRSTPPVPAKVRTKDGVELSLNYYPSSAADDPARSKQVTPVVLLHGEKDTQGVFSSLAARLQSAGADGKTPAFSVVTVDLRGHGASIRQTAPNGATRELDAAKINRNDILAMSTQDMEAVRGFLVGKNDEGALNLNKLCLVGVGLGATVAVNWAAQDWSAPPLLVGKQGQDVKALVLVSPQWKFRGVPLQAAMRRPDMKKQVAWMLVYGEQNPEQDADIKRILRQLERYHPEPVSAQAPPRSLLTLPFPSALEGSGLVSQEGAGLEDKIVEFLTVQVADQDLPWIKRRNRLD